MVFEARQTAHVRDEADIQQVVAEGIEETQQGRLVGERKRKPQLIDLVRAHVGGKLVDVAKMRRVAARRRAIGIE
jgi:hypothetical protein